MQVLSARVNRVLRVLSRLLRGALSPPVLATFTVPNIWLTVDVTLVYALKGGKLGKPVIIFDPGTVEAVNGVGAPSP